MAKFKVVKDTRRGQTGFLVKEGRLIAGEATTRRGAQSLAKQIQRREAKEAKARAKKRR